MEETYVSRSEGNGGNLTPVSPLGEEGKDEGLNEDGAEQELSEVLDAIPDLPNSPILRLGDAPAPSPARRRLRELSLRRRANSPSFLHVVQSDGPSSRLLLCLLDLLLHLPHLLLHLLTPLLSRLHLQTLLHHLRSKDEEKPGGGYGGPAFGEEGRDDGTEEGGEEGHDGEGGEGGGEDGNARMAHGENGSDEERLVSDLTRDAVCGVYWSALCSWCLHRGGRRLTSRLD
jgi:hypothetical protein